MCTGSFRVLVGCVYYKPMKLVVTLDWVGIFYNLKSLMSVLTCSTILWCFTSVLVCLFNCLFVCWVLSYVSACTQGEAGPEGATIIEHVTRHGENWSVLINCYWLPDKKFNPLAYNISNRFIMLCKMYWQWWGGGLTFEDGRDHMGG